ncbi:MAG: hypothetical protein MZV70_18250 [Desulfobacterales bacterium]|nr:hypothetical protein [Desulfobacterales bacterium]
MRLKTKVIVNPESNRGRTRKRWGEIREGLKHFIREFKFEFTEKPLHATDLAREAIKDGTELVIGVGGDGTMNEIANGFYEDRRIINPEATLGLVPSGTGCDLIKSLNIPAGPSRRPQGHHRRPGRAHGRGPGPLPHERRRRGGALLPQRRRFRPRRRGRPPRSPSSRLQRKASSYVRCLVTTMVRYRNKRVRIRVDGRDLPDGEYLIGAVANGRIFGKGMKVAPDARLDDGLFDARPRPGLPLPRVLPPRLEAHERQPRHPSEGLRRQGPAGSKPGPEGTRTSSSSSTAISSAGCPATFEIVPSNLLIKGYLQPVRPAGSYARRSLYFFLTASGSFTRIVLPVGVLDHVSRGSWPRPVGFL